MLLATDSRNSILAELKSGTVNRLVYAPYGSQSAQQPVDATLGFNGQRRETSTGWYHLGNGHRVYDPVLRRFNAPDTLSPFGKGGINTYAYCEGDPINFTDPTGHFVSTLFNVFNTVDNIVDYAEDMSRLFLRARSGTVASRLKLVGYTTASAGAVMHMAGSSSGVVVGMAGGVLVNAARVVEKAPKLFQKLRRSRLGIAVSRRLTPQKAAGPLLARVQLSGLAPGLVPETALRLTEVTVIRST